METQELISIARLATQLAEMAHELAVALEQISRITASSEHSQLAATKSSPCDSCPTRDTCTEPCDQLEQLLPSEDAGRISRTSHGDIPLEVLHHDQGVIRADNRDLMDRFEACRALLTSRRWEVVKLIHGLGLSQKQAAQRLGKAESTVSELLAKASKIMHAFHARRGRENIAPDD